MSLAKFIELKEPGKNLLKSRDDPGYTVFETMEEGKLHCLDTQCSWVKPSETIETEKLRQRIEPWLTALFQSEYLSLLIGSGLTHSVHWIAQEKILPGMKKVSFNNFQDEIDTAANLSAKKAGREKVNIEDQIRVANEIFIGLSHYCSPVNFKGSEEIKKQVITLGKDIKSLLADFAASILDGEKSVACASKDKRENAFAYLVNFLMSIASRSGTRDRLQIFTTNYDRIIEAGAEVAGLHLLDRFVGNLTPIYRSSRLNIDMHYNPPGIRGEPRYLEGVARFTKLHGSVDWVYANNDIRRIGLPFGADSVNPFFEAPGLTGATALNLMIFPNSAKDRETASYPYVELFRDFAAAICRPNSTLVTFGYSFGDEHINRIIEDMLTIPSTHLVIISYDDPLGRIMKIYEKVARPAQTTLMIGNHFGDLKTLVHHYLPKPAIDRTTFRMAELLKSRFGTIQEEKEGKTVETGEGEIE